MAFERREYSGSAVPAILSATIGTDNTPFNVSVITGWPDASDGPFAIIIDEGLATEEKILIGTRVGTTLTPVMRGYDNTSPVGHQAGAKVEHTLTATDFDEANFHIANKVHDHHPQYLNPARHLLEPHVIATSELEDGAVTYPKLAAGQRWEPGDVKSSFIAADHAGWLLQDGREVALATYPGLTPFAGMWGAAAAGNIKLPDARKRGMLGKAAAGFGSVLGAQVGSADAAQVLHGHTINDHTHSGGTADQSQTHWHGLGGHTHYVNPNGTHSHKSSRDDHAAQMIRFDGSTEGITGTNKTTGATGDVGHTVRTDDSGWHDHGTGGPSGGSDAADRGHTHGFTTGGASNRGTDTPGVSATDANIQPSLVVNWFIHV